MSILNVVLLIAVILHLQVYLAMKLRWWIVRKLVGKATVIANCSLTIAEPITLPGDSEARIWDSQITGKGAKAAFDYTV